MALTPQWLDELRSRTTLSSLIAQSVKLTRAGREYKACCPFHNEKSPSFTVNDEKGFYHCFGCSAHGDAIGWMTQQRGLSFIDAVKELADAAGMDVPAPDPRAAKRAEAAQSLRDVTEAAASWFTDRLSDGDGAAARDYLRKRGISNEVQRRFALGFAPDSRGRLKAALNQFPEAMLVESGMLIDVEDKETYDRFRGRLMIPIRDPRGRVIAFGGRILGAGEPKYLNSPDTPLFDKGRTLYNLDRASPASRKTERIIVVEGYMDVIALSQAGIDDVVAPLGTALTEQQIGMIWRMVPVPILCFDGDGAGQKAAMRAAMRVLPLLRPGFSLAFATLPVGRDPDDIVNAGGADAFERIVSTRIDVSEQLWLHELSVTRAETPSERAGLKERLENLSATIVHEDVRREFQKSFRQRFFNEFGWKRESVGQLRVFASEGLRHSARKPGEAIIRAVLLGLMRHTPVLYDCLESVSDIVIDDEYLNRWRNYLISAALDNSNCNEMLIEDILSQTDVSPVEKRDYSKDLAFSFYHSGVDDERARKDLKDVVEVLVDESSIRVAAEQANARFQNGYSDEDLRQFIMLKERMMAARFEIQNVLEASRLAA